MNTWSPVSAGDSTTFQTDTDYLKLEDNSSQEYEYLPYTDYELTIQYTQFYLHAFIIWPGLLFNGLALVCIGTSHTLRRTTTGLYLISLTIADIVFLIGDALRWFNTIVDDKPIIGITFMEDYDFWCKTTFFLRYFGKLASAWITIAITMERFISVAYPLRAGQISTKRNAYIVIGSTYLCCAALSSFPFWTVGLDIWKDYSFCTYLKSTEYNIWNWVINRVGSLLLPSIILFVVTAMIVYKLNSISKHRKRLMGQTTDTNIERQLTLMLIAVSIGFLVLRLPYMVSYYIWDFRNSIWSQMSSSFEAKLEAVYKMTDVIATSNYAVNFFLYCLSGSAFRIQFVALMCCKICGLNRNKNMTTSNTLSISLNTLHKLSPANSRLSINVISNNDLKVNA